MNVLYSTPPRFISLIEAISNAYSLNLDAERSYLRLEKEGDKKPPSSPLILIIEKLDQNIVKVSHYCQDEPLPSKAIAFLSELCEGEQHWTPLEIVQASYSRQVVSLDPDGSIAQFDSPGTQFAAQVCQAWVEELEQQQWHLNGHPLPGITATSRYFPPLAVSPLAKQEPWLHLDSNYRIQGNRSGLLALIEAAASALAVQNEAIAEVFDAHCDSHHLKVTLCHSQAQD